VYQNLHKRQPHQQFPQSLNSAWHIDFGIIFSSQCLAAGKQHDFSSNKDAFYAILRYDWGVALMCDLRALKVCGARP